MVFYTNECLTLLQFYCLLCLSDFVPEAAVKYSIADAYSLIFGMQVALNMLVMLYIMCTTSRKKKRESSFINDIVRQKSHKGRTLSGKIRAMKFRMNTRTKKYN